jgi:hypothetical protein
MKIQGKEVINAQLPLHIQVKKEDIQSAIKKDPNCCPIAQACLRQKGVRAAKVYLSVTYILKGRKWYRYQTTRPMRDEIISYDRYGQFQEDYYTLNPVPPSKQSPRATTKTQKSTNRRLEPHITFGVRAPAPIHGE